MAIPVDALMDGGGDTFLADIGTVPEKSPLEMPAQCLTKHPAKPVDANRPIYGFWFYVKTFVARLITFGGALALTIYACYEMVKVVSVSQVVFTQWLLVGLFAVTFAWIALAATSAVTGFLFGWISFRVKAHSRKTQNSRVVLLMPVFNEDCASSFSALAAMADELDQRGESDRFEIFVISDTNNPQAWVRETAAISSLRRNLTDTMPVWYRRRAKNTGKKAGNVADFIKGWGARYDLMLVLDADSILSAETLISLVREMEADTQCGILQSVPKLVQGRTFLARLQQFAGHMYGGIVAKGIALWQGREGNYWGHNALIRVQAFASCAGLPLMPGKKPFGGEILSHDFVEAALMRRSGWGVRMLPDLSGSWEQGPPSLGDIAVRDRRWSQGNLQHLAVLKTKGLRWPSRVHMLMGVMGYMASPFWLALICVGLLTYFQSTTSTINYFKEEYSLFPTWPIFDAKRMIDLFIFTTLVLLLPKILGLIQRMAQLLFVAPWRIPLAVAGVVIETFFSMLYAPVFMFIHSKHIWDILRGRDSGWTTQQRKAKKIAWLAIFRQHFWHTFIGCGLTFILFYLSLPMLAWMSPTLIGLVLAIPLALISGSILLAKSFKFLGLLVIPEERNPHPIFSKCAKYDRIIRKNVEHLTVEKVLSDNTLLATHFESVLEPEPALRGSPDMNFHAARFKSMEAHSINELLGWLTKEELFSLLSNKDLTKHL